MTLRDLPLQTLTGETTTLGALTAGRAALLVNVASRCGLTPQYAALERLHEIRDDLVVIGVPCNQFKGQEPGSAQEIAEFCSATYGVSFPLTEKVEVNGGERHMLYDELVEVADESGKTGDIAWNFEKFVLDSQGRVVARFNPSVAPDDARVIDAIESVL